MSGRAAPAAGASSALRRVITSAAYDYEGKIVNNPPDSPWCRSSGLRGRLRSSPQTVAQRLGELIDFCRGVIEVRRDPQSAYPLHQVNASLLQLSDDRIRIGHAHADDAGPGITRRLCL